MGIKISAMNAKGSADGTELIPVSHSGSPYSINPEDIKDYIIGEIEGITAAVAVDGNDQIMILDNTDSDTLHPVDIDLVAQHAIDTIWGKGAEATPADGDKLALKDDGDVERTVLLSVMKEWVRSEIEGDILDISDLADGSGALTSTDYMLVTQGTTGKQVTLADVTTEIYTGLVAHVTGLAQVASTTDTDTFYCVQGGTGKYMELSQIIDHAGSPVTKTGSTTDNNIPQWTANDGELDDGLTLATAAFFGAGAATVVATTQAILNTMNTIVDDATDIGVALADADEFLVDDSGVGQRKSTLTRLWTWILSKIVTITDVDDIADIGTGWVLDEDDFASDSATKLATQQSIGAYIKASFAGPVAGIGITGGSNTICVSNREAVGESLYKTTIFIDLTDLHSTADGDIIGVDGTANPCHIGQITDAANGTIIYGKVTCLEAPNGGVTNIEIYSATEGTGSEDDAITGLTETLLLDHGVWAAEEEDYLTTVPAADEYLYLVSDAAGDADYTGGQFLIELWGS